VTWAKLLCMDRIRVAALQYFIRPVESYEQFEAQVRGLVETAADYDAHLLVFPEYFTIQLMTLEQRDVPIRDQVRHLTRRVDQVSETMSALARASGLHIVAGSILVADPDDGDRVYNDSFFFGPDGKFGRQGKLHLTRWEREDWQVSQRSGLKIFETALGRIAIAICYDVEFPEIARTAARMGCNVLVVPSCTDERQGFLRVRYCAQARCIENHLYVVHSTTVGSLPMVPSVALNYGQASILTPSDFPFARDGILAEGVVNQEMMILGDLDMKAIEESRSFGSVLPLNDSARTRELISDPEVIEL